MRYTGIADSEIHKGHTEVLGSGKLLQEICQGFCRNSKACAQVSVEGGEVELGK